MATQRTDVRGAVELEKTLLGLLRVGSPLALDDLADVLPGDCFAQVFLTVDRWSRAGIVRLRPGKTGYRVELIH
ncbi:MAG: hypothetical protein LZF86_130010 [Nitrospira sp.]|nr:MAG: hypothetical protein LZF86_130010 [Nitrospira sp.]